MIFIIVLIVSLLFFSPFIIVILSSFKSKSEILSNPFSFPNSWDLSNFQKGISQINFLESLLNSLFITITSTIVIIVFTSMAAWMITRYKSKLSNIIYYSLLLSMIVPFQLLMYPMVQTASMYYHLDNIFGIIVIYLGFGAGLSVFVFSGFIKSIPVTLEEAALIDGATPIQIFFKVIFPIMKPTVITVAILNIMWIWNDYLLPSRLLSNDVTIPISIQVFVNSRGNVDYGQMMAIILLAIIPVVIFYLACQKYIIKGVITGAIKG